MFHRQEFTASTYSIFLVNHFKIDGACTLCVVDSRTLSTYTRLDECLGYSSKLIAALAKHNPNDIQRDSDERRNWILSPILPPFTCKGD